MEPIPIPIPQGGTRLDLNPEYVPDGFLVNAENVIYRDGEFQVRPGLNVFADDLDERPMGYIIVNHSDGTLRVVQATTAGWYKLVSGAWVDITGTALTGSATDQNIFRTFSKAGATWLLGTNGGNTAKKWDGNTATYADIGGTPPRARTMMVIGSRVILGNLLSGSTISPVAIDVSNLNDFDTGWGSVLVALLADTEGPIMAMLEMGTLQGAIIKTDSIYMLIAQGGTVPFRIEWRRNMKLNGPPAPKLATVMDHGQPVWLGGDGTVNVFDGASISHLPYAVQKQITSIWNPARVNRGWLEYDSERRELWIIFPLVGNDDPNGGVLINMDTYQVYPIRFNTFKMSAGAKIQTFTGTTIGELTQPIGSYTQTIGDFGAAGSPRRMVFGEVGGQTYEDIGGPTDGGTSIPFYWETPVRGQMERYTTVGRVRHRFRPTVMSQVVDVKLGQRNEGGNIAYDAAQSINLSQSGRKSTGHRTSAEYFSLRFEGNASELVEYQGSMLYAAARGRR